MNWVTRKMIGLGALALVMSSAEAAIVSVNLSGTITSGGSYSVSWAGLPIAVGFSYDTATAGVGGVFSGGANFLNPHVDINGVRYVTFADNLAPATLRNITLVDGAPDRFMLTHDVNGYQGITDKSERLILAFAGTSSFLAGVESLPSALNVSGSGLGSFSLLYADDCQNYACGPVLPFFAGASFTFEQLTASAISSVPVPAAFWLLGSSLLGLGRFSRPRPIAQA